MMFFLLPKHLMVVSMWFHSFAFSFVVKLKGNDELICVRGELGLNVNMKEWLLVF